MLLNQSAVFHLYLIGVGQIGSALLQILQQHRSATRIAHLQLWGLSNSRKMVCSREPLSPAKWQSVLQSGQTADLDLFVQAIRADPHPRRIFIDCTADERVARRYPQLFSCGVHVVTPNKIANTLEMAFYRGLFEKAQHFGVQYRYETTVGAALPIISSVRDLLDTGDAITCIEGILSGTLSMLFSSLSGEQPFSALVKDAHRRGLTEPDPRSDLRGLDVARKLLILLREVGLPLELHEIEVESLLPPVWFGFAIAEFWQKLPELDKQFEAMRVSASQKGSRLGYVASWLNGRSRVALHEVAGAGDLAACRAGENLIKITSRRYLDSPLVIKGPGAGPEITAAGVLADILHVASGQNISRS